MCYCLPLLGHAAGCLDPKCHRVLDSLSVANWFFASMLRASNILNVIFAQPLQCLINVQGASQSAFNRS